ncbi:MAG TPA: phospholipase [Kofleriaceae bacterium]
MCVDSKRRWHSIWIAVVAATAIPIAAVATPIPDPPAAPPGLALVEDYVFNVSMDTFQNARNAKVHADILDWSSDGCSNPVTIIGKDHPFGVGDFLPSCQRHDFGYRNYKRLKLLDESMRKRIDDNFRKDLYSYCSRFSGWSSWRGVACRWVANVYYSAVRACSAESSRCP